MTESSPASFAESEPGSIVGSPSSIGESGFSRVSHRRISHGCYFHVTLDDGAAQDRACVDVLEGLRCPATLFISLEAMSEQDRTAYEPLRSSRYVSIQDHSLRHARRFHFRHIVGFHSDE